MHIPKKYFHDRLVLLLLSASTFTALLNAVLIILRLDSSKSSYIVQYRANLGISAYKAGDSTAFWGFVLFGLFILAIEIILSMRAFTIRRQYAIAICSLCLLLLVLAIIVSSALLTLS